MSAARKAVAFDLDGTLIDSAPAIAAVGDALMRELGLAPLSLSEGRGYVGGGAGVFVARALAARGRAPATDGAELSRFLELYAAAPPAAGNRPYPGAEAALRALRDRGYALALCTNKPAKPTAAVLRALGWTGLFDAVVDGDAPCPKKPDPAPLRRCATLLGGVTPAALVGDSEADAGCAEAAGAPLLLYTQGYRHAPLETLPYRAAFDHHGALPSLMDAIARSRP
ncbi:MAG: phosphoglycolate phosphatase [Pseudomonadota bacterium]